MPRLVLLFLLSLVLARPLLAESPPEASPQLRIEAGAHTAAVRRVAVSGDGRFLVTGSDDKSVRVWDAATGALAGTLRVPQGSGDDGKIYAAAISPDGAMVAAGGWDHTDGQNLLFHVYLFDRASGRLLARLGPVANAVNDLAFSADGTLLAAGLATGGIAVWQGPDWAVLGGDSDYGGAVYSLAFRPDGGLVVASHDGLLRVYDADFSMSARVPAPSGETPDSLAIAPDGSKLAIGYGGTSAVDVLALPDPKRLLKVDTKGLENGDLGAVAWSADGNTLFAGGSYNTPEERMPVFAWSEGGTGPRQAFDAAGDTIMDITALPGGGVAVAGADHTLTVLEDDGRLRFRNGPVAADMRGKLGEAFLISADAQRVRFGLGVSGREPWQFDVASLRFAASPEGGAELHAAQLDGLPLTGWNSSDTPSLAGRRLALDRTETSRAAAIAPSKSWLALGTDYALRRFEADGSLAWSRPVPEVTWGVNVDAGSRLIVAAHLDGTVRWYRADDGGLLLSLFVRASDKRWIAWTPKGYFAASPGGEGLMGWLVNRGWTDAPDFFPASQLHDRFYRPDIVTLVLAAGDEEQAIREANDAAHRKTDDREIADALPPTIEILSPAAGTSFSNPSVTLHYRVHSPSDKPVTGIDVLIDGRPPATRGVNEAPSADGEDDIEVALPPRNVEVSLIARNSDGASVPASISLHYDGAAAAVPKGKLFAVLAGVSDYAEPSLRLQYADDDARAFGEVLARLAGRNYADVETRVFTDAEASDDNIRSALSWLEDSVGEADTGILFLAGHGVTDPKERFYYLPVGGLPAPDRLRSTAISDSEIQDAISRIAGKVIFFIDACHAAAGLAPGRGAADLTGVVNRLSRSDTGVVMFASSTGREVSFESSAWQHGAFTAALLEGLAGSADYQKDGRITVAELNLWLSSRVAELTDARQNAVMVKPDTIKDFAVAEVLP